MNPRPRWLTIAALLAIFLAGAVTGWLFPRPGRPHGPPHGADLAAHLRMRLTRELALTPQQIEKMNPIVTESATELDKVRHDSEERATKMMDEMHAKLAAILTPEQLEKLAALRERRRAIRDARPGK
jgi:Spy/CpxP family protein refolding chaperone